MLDDDNFYPWGIKEKARNCYQNVGVGKVRRAVREGSAEEETEA